VRFSDASDGRGRWLLDLRRTRSVDVAQYLELDRLGAVELYNDSHAAAEAVHELAKRTEVQICLSLDPRDRALVHAELVGELHLRE
jgi:hypothetical protein